MSLIGWKYVANLMQVKAYETAQKYKEGRFILERLLLQELT
jgi:hypothetical protein